MNTIIMNVANRCYRSSRSRNVTNWNMWWITFISCYSSKSTRWRLIRDSNHRNVSTITEITWRWSPSGSIDRVGPMMTMMKSPRTILYCNDWNSLDLVDLKLPRHSFIKMGNIVPNDRCATAPEINREKSEGKQHFFRLTNSFVRW